MRVQNSNRPVDDDEDLYTIEQFAENVRRHFFIDYDGHGNLATATEVSSVEVRPSSFLTMEIPPWATHVAWYNK